MQRNSAIIEMEYPSYEKIADALRTIKKVCQNHRERQSLCEDCPFNVNGCVFADALVEPANWQLAPLPKEWRAFN